MKKIFTILLAALGLNTACSQNYEDMDVQAFAELIADTNTVVLDVRTAAEFNEAHIKDAVNIDQDHRRVLPQWPTLCSCRLAVGEGGIQAREPEGWHHCLDKGESTCN